jgi:hypothetical protein
MALNEWQVAVQRWRVRDAEAAPMRGVPSKVVPEPPSHDLTTVVSTGPMC